MIFIRKSSTTEKPTTYLETNDISQKNIENDHDITSKNILSVLKKWSVLN